MHFQCFHWVRNRSAKTTTSGSSPKVEMVLSLHALVCLRREGHDEMGEFGLCSISVLTSALCRLWLTTAFVY